LSWLDRAGSDADRVGQELFGVQRAPRWGRDGRSDPRPAKAAVRAIVRGGLTGVETTRRHVRFHTAIVNSAGNYADHGTAPAARNEPRFLAHAGERAALPRRVSGLRRRGRG